MSGGWAEGRSDPKAAAEREEESQAGRKKGRQGGKRVKERQRWENREPSEQELGEMWHIECGKRHEVGKERNKKAKVGKCQQNRTVTQLIQQNLHLHPPMV